MVSFLNTNGKIYSIYVFFFQTIYALQIISLEAIKSPHNSHRKFKTYSASFSKSLPVKRAQTVSS